MGFSSYSAGASEPQVREYQAASVPHDLAPRRRRRRRVTPRFYRMLALLAGLLVVASYGVALWRVRQVDGQIAATKRAIAAAEMRNQQLREELERLTSDDHVEDVAREDLGLVKEGETAFVVVKPQDSADPYHVERRKPPGQLSAGEGW